MSHNTVLSEPVLRRPRIIQWFAARPRIVNVLVTLACTVPTVTALVLVPPAHAWLGYLCAAGVAVAFWWRRPRPLPVLLIVVGLAALNPISGASSSVAVFESLFGVYTLASLARLRTAILGYLLSEAVIFAVAGVALLLGFRETLPAVLLQPTASIALAIGVAVRASRARRSALEDLVAMREERAAAVERARITAEMHDVVAHSVTVMIALAGGARAGWEKHPERARDALEQLAAGLPVTLNCADAAMSTEPALRTTVYRIVQEALTNALRSATDASYVEVTIKKSEDQLTVTVTDNGKPNPSAESLGAGVGLRGRPRSTLSDEIGPTSCS